MLAQLDSFELTQWAAFMRINPQGERRADLRMGVVAAVTANSQGARAKPSDFMPDFGDDEPDWERMAETLECLASAPSQ